MIRKALSVLSVTVLIPALLAACSSHVGKPDSQEINTAPSARVVVTTDIVYTPPNWPETLTADLYKPVIEGGGPFPGVVMIHGGGWTSRTRADMDKISRAVASRGYVVMNVSYRLAPKYRYPAPLQDVTQAVTWLRKNAQVNNVRPDRIGTWGYSAGAHLATLAGLTGPGDKEFVEGTRVQAVVAGGTPVDVRLYKQSPLTNALMGVPYDKNPEAWRLASPISLVSPDDPPVFLYHGTFDYTVGVKNSETMYEKLNAAHVPTELYTMRGLDHFATFLVDAPVEQGIAFLDRYLR